MKRRIHTETFFALRRTDGELIMDEFEWVAANGPDDWTWADEDTHSEPVEYELVEMTVRPIAKRTYGVQKDHS